MLQNRLSHYSFCFPLISFQEFGKTFYSELLWSLRFRQNYSPATCISSLRDTLDWSLWTVLEEAQGQLQLQTCVPARMKSNLSGFWCSGLLPLKKTHLFTIQISLSAQQQWHSPHRGSQQSTNIINSLLLPLPSLQIPRHAPMYLVLHNTTLSYWSPQAHKLF